MTVGGGLEAVVFAPQGAAAPGRWPAVGLSFALPPGQHTLEVAVEGQPLDDGSLSPTVARVGPASRRSAAGDLWGGEALRRGHRGWVTHPFVVRAGEGLAGRVSVAVGAVVHRSVTGAVTVRVRVEGQGEAAGAVLFGPGQGPSWWVRYDAGCPEGVQLAGWCDRDPALAAVLRTLGARARVTVLDGRGRAVAGRWTGEGWGRVLRALGRGAVRSVEVTGDDDAAGWSLGASLRGDTRPVERCAWMPAAIPAAVAAMPGALQWGAGPLAEPVLPRRVTGWELAHGVGSLPVEGSWLGRYARGPFATGGLAARGAYDEAETVAPSAEAWQREELLGRAGIPLRRAS